MAGDGCVLLCDAPPEGLVVGFEAGDLAVAGVRDLADVGDPPVEFAGEVLPGAGLAVFGDSSEK